MEVLPLSDSGIAYFCLKVADSRKQEWRWEQRFDKLYEALEILCRYVPTPESASMSMADRVPLAFGLVGTLERNRIAEMLKSDELLMSVRTLAKRAAEGLQYEAKTAKYLALYKEEMRRQVRFFEKDSSAFERNRVKNPEQAAVALLQLFVALRNARFHAYAGTSGDVIGYEQPLRPICEALEGILLLIAASQFGVTPAVLENALVGAHVQESRFALWMNAARAVDDAK
jgi:hypothetical protein